MRIDFTGVGLGPQDQGKPGRTGQAEARPIETGGVAPGGNPASTTVAGDEARFSFDQTRLQSLQAQVLAHPEIREARVQALQASLGIGTYSVPPSQVADALLSDVGA
jgi:flagellar biosynthesis anti-sigma factor FlgM